MGKTLFFQKKIKLFNVQFMLLHVNAQRKDKFIAFDVEFSARLDAMTNPILATVHKITAIFFKFFVLFPRDTVCLQKEFAKINGRNKHKIIVIHTEQEIRAMRLLEIIHMNDSCCHE